MKHKKNKFIFYFSSIIFILLLFLNISFLKIGDFPSDFYISYDEVEQVNKTNRFGQFVKLNLESKEIKTGDKKEEKSSITFKLFGIIPVKKVTVKLLPTEEVYTGGIPIGLNVNSDGAIVVSDSEIDLKQMSNKKNSILKNGDIITKINGEKINNSQDIENILNKINDNKINITYLRKNKEINQSLPLLKDENNNFKLGVWVRDDLSGVGTLTFVRKDNHYAALGHAITNGEGDNTVPITDGRIYTCSLVGITKGEKNKPGELKCVFVNRDCNGDIKKNTKYGIYGMLYEENDLIDYNLKLNLGGRLSVKPGKATIISNVSGLREEYEIEIIKAKYQNKMDDKSIVFRVKDKRLLDLTGGIIQGMSGSPIIQDGKIVGAVTHVFLSDSTKGYGVYCDWMLKQMDF